MTDWVDRLDWDGDGRIDRLDLVMRKNAIPDRFKTRVRTPEDDIEHHVDSELWVAADTRMRVDEFRAEFARDDSSAASSESSTTSESATSESATSESTTSSRTCSSCDRLLKTAVAAPNPRSSRSLSHS